jgi:hypothetical protein
MFRRKNEEIACVGLVIVARPAKGLVSTDWLPPELAPMLVWDHDAEIATALGVHLVPLASFITANGTEVTRVLGEESAPAVATHLLELRRWTGGHGGTH